MWWPFKKQPSMDAPVVPVEEQVAKFAIEAPPVTINPTPIQELDYATYRADAIARCLEQRLEEGMPPHPEQGFLLAEAALYGQKLLSAGRWTEEQLDKLLQRLNSVRDQ